MSAKKNKITLLLIAPFLCCMTALASTEEEKESPWLVTPTISSDPKLGTTLGGIAAYLHRFDENSEQSMFGLFGTYSNTDSYVAGIFGELYFDSNKHKVVGGIVGGKIRNDYDDFLGTGIPAKTEDDIEAAAIRYLHLIGSNWYIGAQYLSSNYAIGADDIFSGILEQIGLTGFDSAGLGLVAEYDTRDIHRNPTQGDRFRIHNIAYRESLGGEESFDVYRADYTTYLPFGNHHVLAIDLDGRWTSDAPLAGYSSVLLRGYTRGNYLAEHYSHLDFDGRFALNDRWGLTAFGGVGCLYASLGDCDQNDNLYFSIGGGVSYLLKPEAGIVMRMEYAKGEADNSAFYLRLGHPY